MLKLIFSLNWLRDLRLNLRLTTFSFSSPSFSFFFSDFSSWFSLHVDKGKFFFTCYHKLFLLVDCNYKCHFIPVPVSFYTCASRRFLRFVFLFLLVLPIFGLFLLCAYNSLCNVASWMSLSRPGYETILNLDIEMLFYFVNHAAFISRYIICKDSFF